MTAEIAVMNKHGIALASDSAVTISHADGEKVFNSVNKLFALSKYAAVGVMIYGDADFMEVPWEPLLKIYRAQLKAKRFDSVAAYAKNLTTFIEKHPLFVDRHREASAFARRVTQFLLMLRSQIDFQIRMLTYKGAQVTTEQIRNIVDSVMNAEEEHLTHHPDLPRSPKGLVRKKARVVGEVRNMVFKKLSLTDRQKKRLVGLVEKLFYSNYLPHTTGIVVAGFGEDEIYPNLTAMQLDGVYAGRLRFTSDALQITDRNTATLIPFAQSEMVATFMHGIDPRLARALDTSLSSFLNSIPADAIVKRLGLNAHQHAELNKILKSLGNVIVDMFQKNSRDYQKRVHVDPVIAALAHLPKEELADLAESLVHLTSVKRRVALDTETVGGPIDVAVISKGDGFIWLKRKHYFRSELNPHFFATYYTKDGDYGV